MKLIIEDGWPEERAKAKDDRICGHCGAYLETDEKYCRFCGTRRGVGVYVPKPVEPWLEPCIYGPPIRRIHKCTACTYQWDSMSMLDDEKYCPRCGSPAQTIYDEYKARSRSRKR